MSKHLINQTNVNGIEMVLECGYDRPTGSFFANIHSEGEIYYTSLAELGSKDSGWLLTVTAEHGLVVPRKMMDRLAIEAMFDGSNDLIEHEPYTQTEFDRRLLQLGFRQQMPSVLPTDNPVWAWFTDSEEDLGTYALLQSKDCQAYVPSLLCDVMPQEGEWPVFDEQYVLKRLDTMHARLLKGTFQKHPGEGIGSVLNRILGFVPPILGNPAKLPPMFGRSQQAMAISRP